MADKEILAVEIDDSEFSAFKKKFDEYESAVKAMPAQWQKSSTEIIGQKTNFEKMLKGVDEQNRLVSGALVSQTKLNGLLDAASITFGSLHKSGKLFASNIVRSTQSLMHWTKLTAVFSGLLGAGGLFGINRMAASVAAQRTSAAGLGVSYGEQASFLTNFGRLGNAEGILQGFSQAETDVSKKYALRQYLGHIESGDPAKDFAEGLGRFKKFVDQYKNQNELLGPMLHARGYDRLGIGTEQARIIQGMSAAEVAQISGAYRGDLASRLGLPPDVAKKWQDFSMQMEKAGEEINTIFARKAVKLAGPLEHLSESFIHLTENLLKDGSPISGWIKTLGKGIRTFADELGSGAAQAKAAEISRNVADIVKLFDAIVAKAPNGLAVLLGIGTAARFGGAAVAAGGALAGAVSTGALAGATAIGGVAAGLNKLMPQHPERLKRGQEYENAGGSPASPHPAMTEHKRQAIRDYFNKGGFGPFSHEQTSAEGIDYNSPGLPHFAEGGIVTKPTMAMVGESGPEAIVPLSGFNLGNIRARKGGWRQFETPADAAHAIIDQIARYPKMFPKQHDVDTLAGALKRYSPRGDHNDPAAYAREVEQWTGISRHAPMHLHDPEEEAKIVYGIARKEGHLGSRTLEDFRGMFIRHGEPLRRSFGHIGHHPATIGRRDNSITVQDNTGGLVSVAAH
jgi:hypothetical protein